MCEEPKNSSGVTSQPGLCRIVDAICMRYARGSIGFEHNLVTSDYAGAEGDSGVCIFTLSIMQDEIFATAEVYLSK